MTWIPSPVTMTESAESKTSTAENDAGTLRAILVGAGGFGQAWWGLNRTDLGIRVIAIADPDETAREDAGVELAVEESARFRGLGDAVAAVEADVILDCSPPQIHAAHSLIASLHHLHQFVAKPLAANWRDAVRMVATADEAGLVIGVNEQLRYGWLPLALAHEVQSGAIGAIESIELTFREPSSWDGWRATMDNPLLIDASVQHFDMIRAVTGLEVESAYCREWRRACSSFSGAGSATAILTLTGGIPVTYSASWDASAQSGDRTGWWGNWRIQGSGGEIRAEGGRGLWIDGRGAHAVVEALDVEKLSIIVLDQFIRAVRTGAAMATDGWSDLRTMAMVELCRRSSATKRVVHASDLDPPLTASTSRPAVAGRSEKLLEREGAAVRSY